MTTTEALTGILVLITGFYAWATYHMLKVMAAQAEALARPYVSIYPFLEPGNPIFYLRITNAGRGTAEKLRLSIDRSFFKFGESDPKSDLSTFSAFNQQIESFPSGAEIVFSLAQGFVIFAQGADPARIPQVFSVTANYQFGKKSFSETTRIDLRPYLHADVPQEATNRKLKEISDSLKAIAKTLSKS